MSRVSRRVVDLEGGEEEQVKRNNRTLNTRTDIETLNVQTVSNKRKKKTLPSTNVKNVKICKKTENDFCGECVRKVLKNDLYVTCNNCTLEFHFKCVDENDVKLNNQWYCNNCFHKAANDELPLNEGFIDLKCKIRKGLKIAHINIQGLIHKVDEVNLLLNDNSIDVLCINRSLG